MRSAASVTVGMVMLQGSARAFRIVVGAGLPRRTAGTYRRARSVAGHQNAIHAPAFSWTRAVTSLRAGADDAGRDDGDGITATAEGDSKKKKKKTRSQDGAGNSVGNDEAAGTKNAGHGPLGREYVPPWLVLEMEAEEKAKAEEEEEQKRLLEEGGVDLAANPLLQQKGLPKFETISPETVQPAIETLLHELEAGFAQFEADLEDFSSSDSWAKDRMRYSYGGVLERMEKLRAPLEYSWGVVSHLTGVKNSDALREVHQALQPKVVTVFQKMGQSKAVYKALKFLQVPAAQRHLNEAQMRVVEASVRQMELGGVGLEGEAKEQFNRIQLELAELSTKFSNNVLDATKGFSLTIMDKADVDGLPASALALAAQSAKSAGSEEATPESGPWRITLDMPSYLPCMQHLKNRSIREKMYRAFITRASSSSEGEGGKSLDNEPLISQILERKKSMAGLLGFESYAEVSLASKMAGSVDEVDQLSQMLRARSYPAAERELKELKAYAADKGHTGEVELWDVTYWAERRKEELFSFSEEELRPYFPLPKVLEGMFGLAKRLFGVSISPADGDAEVWHPDVNFFNVKDAASDEHVASFYLDPYSRPENKRGGAWMGVCVGRSRALGRSPVAYLTCNGSPPVGETPSLMTFREVETLFHEFGHGLQHMLTQVEDGDCAGINGVEWDAVELPSQFMENWCYHRPTVYQFANHYETSEALPSDLFDKLRAQKTYMAGSGMLRQLYFGQLDMELHHRYDPTAEDAENVFDVQRRVAKQYTVLPSLPEDRFLCSFGHIFAGGYAAGYYSYKYAEVMSADAFAAFEEAGLDDEEAVSRVGRRFKDTVLGMGGGRHPAKVFQDFRGRDPAPHALLKHCGLAEPEPATV